MRNPEREHQLHPMASKSIYFGINEFVRQPNYKDRLEIANKINTPVSQGGSCIAGDMYQDIACNYPLNIEEKMDLLTAAKNSWETSLSFQNIVTDKLNRYTQQAAINLACLPLWLPLAVDRKIPTITAIQKSYDKLINIGMGSLDYIKELPYNTTPELQTTKNDLRGIISEINGLLLLQRFSMKTLKDESFVAVPSTISQNYAKKLGSSGLNKGWDISVYTKNNPDIPRAELAYKLQIKTHRQANNDKYSPDIHVIGIQDDLTTKPSATNKYDAIVIACATENQSYNPNNNNYPDFNSPLMLDEKTELLLDILG